MDRTAPTAAATGRTSAEPELQARADAAWFGLDFDADASADSARKLLADCAAAGAHEGSACLQARLLCVLAWHGGMRRQGLDEALAHGRRAQALADEAGCTSLRPRVHLALAMVLGALGDRAGRFEQLEAARAEAAGLGDAHHEQVALHDLGLDYDRPELLELALERARSLPPGGVGVVANLLHSVAPLLRAADVERAQARCEEAWTLAQALPGAGRWQLEALRILATTRAAAGRHAAARQALQMLQRHPAAPPPQVHLTTARVQAAAGRRAAAMRAYEDCLRLDAPPRLHLDAARELAPLLAAARRWRGAYECRVRVEELRARLQHDENERRLQGLEVQHRLALREQQVAQEQARHRELSRYVERLEAANREITELSERDALTGQFNRRRADAELAAALARLRRGGGDGLALALADIDHFKSVNDRLGHAAGDAVLRAVAQAMAAELRSTDLLARYGGEEFVLLLPAAQPGAALPACERIRSAVERLAVDRIAPGLRVTVSIGLAEARADDDADALLRRADGCLYRAKHGGRNRVVAGD